MSLRPRTTLIIPAYNEAERLQTGFERLMRGSDEGRIDLDDLSLLYVDDGSTDDTASVARSIIETVPNGSVLVQAHNQGKGAAIRAGVAVARTDLLAFTDADMAIDPRQLPSLLGALGVAPVAVGNRAVAGKIDYGSSLRTRAGRTFNLLVRMLSDVELPDTQCGWKGARTAEAKLLFHLTTIDGFAFDVELLARASMLGWTVAEVPVSWSDVGGSHVRLLRDSTQMLSDLITARLRPRSPAPCTDSQSPERPASPTSVQPVPGPPWRRPRSSSSLMVGAPLRPRSSSRPKQSVRSAWWPSGSVARQ